MKYCVVYLYCLVMEEEKMNKIIYFLFVFFKIKININLELFSFFVNLFFRFIILKKKYLF